MRLPLHLTSGLALALGLLACNGQPDAKQTTGGLAADLTTGTNAVPAAEEDPADLPDSATSPPPAPVQTASQPPADGPYQLLGVLDPDMDNMVAFALKVPRAWQVKQSFHRRWEGAMPYSQIYLGLTAPDGRAQIEYLPANTYVYSDGPMTQQLRQQKRELGMSTQMADNELAPMPAVTYVKQVLLPQLARNGLTLRDVGNEQEAPEKRGGENQQVESRGSVDGVLPNGNRARVECRITLQSQQGNGDTYYSWNAIPSITQSTGDLAAAYAHTRVAQESIVRNPTWVQKNRELQNRGAQMNSDASWRQHEATMGQIRANTDAMTAAHNARMGDIKRQGDANTARYNERMAAMDVDKAAFDSRMASGDKQQEIRIDGIRGESKYADPTTGERVKVADGYNHVYRNQQDPTLYYGANTPLDPQQVNWQELQKVSLKDY